MDAPKEPPDAVTAELEAARKRLGSAPPSEPALYRRIVETTSEGVVIADLQGVYRFVNPPMAAMLGYTPEEMIGKPAFTFFDPSMHDEIRARLARRREGASQRYEIRCLHKRGHVVWIQINSTPFLDAQGKVEGSLALAIDITARRKADEVRDELAAIVGASDEAIISRDLAGVIRTWNRGAERLFQYSAEEAIGQPISMLYMPQDAAELAATRKEVDAGRRVGSLEITGRRKDGVAVIAAVKASLLTNPDGKTTGAVVMARDITEQRKAEKALAQTEEQLRQAQKMESVGRLAGGVAHDFNNLLTVILSYTSLAIDAVPPGGLRSELEEVMSAAVKAATLTRQLLAFSRQQILEPQILDLNERLLGLESILRRVLGEDIELKFLRQQVGNTYADPGQIEQVVMNLVVNARDAMPDGGHLTLETANVDFDAAYAEAHVGVKPGPYVMLAVTDSGSGMTPETVARIFEPFFTTKGVGKGTGLGLSTVFGIVKQSGGHIWVYSEPNVGTTFKVYLPRTDRAQAPVATAPEPAAARGGTETILLVEDEESVRLTVQTILRRKGYRVLEAKNGTEAIRIASTFSDPIHLLLTDVVMPQMNGRQLAERVTALRPALNVLYVSGYTENTIVHHGILDAGIFYLPKPITPESLARKVREVLDAPFTARRG